MSRKLRVKKWGLVDYNVTYQKMQDFVAQMQKKSSEDSDYEVVNELWIVEHPSVYTIGRSGKETDILNPKHNIPIKNVDRGGKITFHSPGQIIFYPLLNLKHLNINIKKIVYNLEQLIIDALGFCGIKGERKENAPGVYVNQKKIASLGLRIKSHICYHGVSLNYDMDLKPFHYINPCGYKDLVTTNITKEVKESSLKSKLVLVEFMKIQFIKLFEFEELQE